MLFVSLTRKSCATDQWSYYASIFSSAAKLGGVRFGGYLVPRAASGWPPGSGGERHMVGGLFRKIMTYVGGGAKAIKYFCFGREHPKPRLCSHCLCMRWISLAKSVSSHLLSAPER